MSIIRSNVYSCDRYSRQVRRRSVKLQYRMENSNAASSQVHTYRISIDSVMYICLPISDVHLFANQVGVVSYGDGAHNEFFINEAPDSAQLVNHLKTMAFHGGAADAAEAVRFAYRVSNINHCRNSINQSIFQGVQFYDRSMVNLTAKAWAVPYSVTGNPPPPPPPSPASIWGYTNLGYVVLHVPRPWTASRKPAEKTIETTELIMFYLLSFWFWLTWPVWGRFNSNCSSDHIEILLASSDSTKQV